MTARRPETNTGVRWEMDHEAALDLITVLVILEDFLRLGSEEALEELARFPIARPLDPCQWAHWLADYLGDQVLALRAADRTTTATGPTPTGDLP